MTLDNTGKSVAKRVSSFGELVKRGLVKGDAHMTHDYDSDDEVRRRTCFGLIRHGRLSTAAQGFLYLVKNDDNI